MQTNPVHTFGTWIDLDGFLVEWSFWLDTPAIAILSLLAAVSLICAAFRYVSFVSAAVILASSTLVIASNNLLILFAGLQGLSCAGFFLAADEPADGAGKPYLGVQLLGDALLLVAFCLLWFSSGSLSYVKVSSFTEHAGFLGGELSPLLLANAFLFAGVAFKASVVPFFYWLPAYFRARDPYACLVSVITPITSLYVLFRFRFLPSFVPELQWPLICVAACVSFGCLLLFKSKGLRANQDYQKLGAGLFRFFSQAILLLSGLVAFRSSGGFNRYMLWVVVSLLCVLVVLI
jgi:NADH:ubiquinone oxidoreductase subunit 2 (subunit N)